MDIFNEDSSAGIAFSPEAITKESITLKAGNIVSDVLNGHLCPLETYIKSKAISDVAASICKEIKEDAISEADKYSSEDKVLGVTFATKNTANTYDFSDDSEWVRMDAEIKYLKSKIKAYEAKMIQAMQYAEMVDKDGAIITPAKIKKAGGTTIAITIPKI
jgi:hypothetical protein